MGIDYDGYLPEMKWFTRVKEDMQMKTSGACVVFGWLNGWAKQSKAMAIVGGWLVGWFVGFWLVG